MFRQMIFQVCDFVLNFFLVEIETFLFQQVQEPFFIEGGQKAPSASKHTPRWV